MSNTDKGAVGLIPALELASLTQSVQTASCFTIRITVYQPLRDYIKFIPCVRLELCQDFKDSRVITRLWFEAKKSHVMLVKLIVLCNNNKY